MDNIINVINELEKNRHQMNISKESIEFISIISSVLKPKNILEIGSFNGYSALCLSLCSKKVITLESNKENAKLAQDNFNLAKTSNIKLVFGDALETLKKLKNKFQIILIDGKKLEYKQYLELSLNLLDKKGLIFVDNTISHNYKLKEFFNYLERSNLYYKELNLGKGLMLIYRSI